MTIAGDAEDRKANQDAGDDGRVARDSILIAEIEDTTVIIDELGWPIAERGQMAPVVEAERRDREDGGHIGQLHQAMTIASYVTGLHDPSASKEAAPVDGKEHHSNATNYIDNAESVAFRPAFIRLIVFTAV